MPRKRLSVSTTEAARERGRGPRRGKYNAKGAREDGHWFASAAELHRYRQLREMVQSGTISSLELQPSYPLMVNGRLIGRYRADFRYHVLDPFGRIQRQCVEDVKGFVTDIYVLKKKLVSALHNIEIQELPARQIAQWVDRVP